MRINPRNRSQLLQKGEFAGVKILAKIQLNMFLRMLDYQSTNIFEVAYNGTVQGGGNSDEERVLRKAVAQIPLVFLTLRNVYKVFPFDLPRNLRSNMILIRLVRNDAGTGDGIGLLYVRHCSILLLKDR